MVLTYTDGSSAGEVVVSERREYADDLLAIHVGHAAVRFKYVIIPLRHSCRLEYEVLIWSVHGLHQYPHEQRQLPYPMSHCAV